MFAGFALGIDDLMVDWNGGVDERNVKRIAAREGPMPDELILLRQQGDLRDLREALLGDERPAGFLRDLGLSAVCAPGAALSMLHRERKVIVPCLLEALVGGELDEVILHTLCAILSNETKRVGKVSALNIATGCCKCLVSA